jgi:hypothetical protein
LPTAIDAATAPRHIESGHHDEFSHFSPRRPVIASVPRRPVSFIVPATTAERPPVWDGAATTITPKGRIVGPQSAATQELSMIVLWAAEGTGYPECLNGIGPDTGPASVSGLMGPCAQWSRNQILSLPGVGTPASMRLFRHNSLGGSHKPRTPGRSRRADTMC